MPKKYYVIAQIDDMEGGRCNVLLEICDTPDDALKKINRSLEPGILGQPNFSRPLHIFLIKGVEIPIAIREVASIKTKEGD